MLTGSGAEMTQQRHQLLQQSAEIGRQRSSLEPSHLQPQTEFNLLATILKNLNPILYLLVVNIK